MQIALIAGLVLLLFGALPYSVYSGWVAVAGGALVAIVAIIFLLVWRPRT